MPHASELDYQQHCV